MLKLTDNDDGHKMVDNIWHDPYSNIIPLMSSLIWVVGLGHKMVDNIWHDPYSNIIPLMSSLIWVVGLGRKCLTW